MEAFGVSSLDRPRGWTVGAVVEAASGGRRRSAPTSWCSDGLEITCDNGEKVRVAFALDCCEREVMGHVATTGGITANDVQDLMVATAEHRKRGVNRVPELIEGSPITAAATPFALRGLSAGAFD